MQLSFLVDDQPLQITLDTLIVAGWAGRDQAAIEHHIEELAAIGVARPSTVPLYYRVATNQMVQAERVQVLGEDSSGEAEVFIFEHQGELYVSCASDHTDRKLEAYGVAHSKQICVKPVASVAWRFADVKDYWDDLVLRSYIFENGKKILYQEGNLSSLQKPLDLIKGYQNGDATLVPGTAMLCGTVPAIGGIKISETFSMELYDPVQQRTIEHTYTATTLPVIF